MGNRSRLPAELPTLAEELRRRGWRTGAVVSSAILGPATHIDRGFDLFDKELEQREGVRTWVKERTAAPTTDAAIREYGELLEESDIDDIRKDLEICKQVLSGGDPEDLRLAIDQLQDSSYRFAAKMYDENVPEGEELDQMDPGTSEDLEQ